MTLFFAILSFIFAFLISGLAAAISITGMVALFPAGGLIIALMIGTLEAGKLVAASWLHANWNNTAVNVIHKAYLGLAVVALMFITAIGIYGYLSKGYLDQSQPLESVSIEIEQRETTINQEKTQIARLTARQNQLDAAVDSLIQQQKVIPSQRLRDTQKNERASIAKDIEKSNQNISRLNAEILPLKHQTNDVSAKLGPVKYVAALFGWQDADSAVRLVILTLMFAFDPLAVVLVLSGAISSKQWIEERKKSISPEIIAPVIGIEPVIEPETIEKIEDTEANIDLSTPASEILLHPIPAQLTEVFEPVVDHQPDDRELLLSLLEKNPALMREMIAAVVDEKQKMEETPHHLPESSASASGWLP